MFTIDQIKNAAPQAREAMLAQNDAMYFAEPIAKITKQIGGLCERVQHNRTSARLQRQQDNREAAMQLATIATRLLAKRAENYGTLRNELAKKTKRQLCAEMEHNGFDFYSAGQKHNLTQRYADCLLQEGVCKFDDNGEALVD